jgi:SAM-dependent methyltransferase
MFACPEPEFEPRQPGELFLGALSFPESNLAVAVVPAVTPLTVQSEGQSDSQSGGQPGSVLPEKPLTPPVDSKQLTRFVHTRFAYDNWYTTVPGSVALAAQQRLLDKMLAPWVGVDSGRRGPGLLELFCGSGLFLEQFCRLGFNVSGQEHDMNLAQQAKNRLGSKADIIQNNPEQLPFNDQSFDYVVCVNGLEFAANAENLLREAMRLAVHGILVGFPNFWSLRGLEALGKKYTQEDLPWQVPYGAYKRFAPITIWTLFGKMGTRAILTWKSTLFGPACTWKENALCRRLNMLSLPVALGGATMLRLDFAPSPAGTPLLLSSGRE